MMQLKANVWMIRKFGIRRWANYHRMLWQGVTIPYCGECGWPAGSHPRSCEVGIRQEMARIRALTGISEERAREVVTMTHVDMPPLELER